MAEAIREPASIVAPPPVSPRDEAAWQAISSHWKIRAGTCYLNHGSFGPVPESVRRARCQWQQALEEQPMDFYVRRFEPALFAARARLADFLGTAAGNLVFCENATSAMNSVAQSVRFQPHEEALLTDHEYGAVRRIWERHARRNHCQPPRVVDLPRPIESIEHVVDTLFAAVRPQTRLLVVSHITSPTAITLPVQAIAARARAQGVAVCVDGPHAIAQLPLSLDALDCDFYAASCHKWLSAPLGSGFLFVHPRAQAGMTPANLSWGRVRHEETPVSTWDDEFQWSGTRDPSAYLSVPAAIDFLAEVGWENFRARSRFLAAYAFDRLSAMWPGPTLAPRDGLWYAGMAHVRLPPGPTWPLQQSLWERYGIEVPIVPFGGERFVRVSCHLYNTIADIDLLALALKELVSA